MKDEKILNMEPEAAENAASFDAEESSMVIKLKKPYMFERQEYNEIDLSGLNDLTASDMIAVNKIMQRTAAGLDIMPEVSVEYACHIAARASKLPVEFFMNLPPNVTMKVKNRVMGFLFGSE